VDKLWFGGCVGASDMGINCSGCCSRDVSDAMALSREMQGIQQGTRNFHIGEEWEEQPTDKLEGFLLDSPSSSSKHKAWWRSKNEDTHIFREVLNGPADSPVAAPPMSWAPPTDPVAVGIRTFSEYGTPLKSVNENREITPTVTPRCRIDTDEIWGSPSTKDCAPCELSEPTEGSSTQGSSALPSPASCNDIDGKKKKKWRTSLRKLSFRANKTPSKKNQPVLDGRTRIKTTNSNAPSHYYWLEAPLRSIATNRAVELGAKDAQTQKAFTPLFFVIGGCPNYFCGMQVIAYFISSEGDPEVDFWWVKPKKGAEAEMEYATLCRQSKGQHKNDPGRSKPFYKPLADMFSEGHVDKDGRRYAIEAPPGETSRRAFIEENCPSKPKARDKLWLHLVWQEDWTSNPLARSKYIRGKIVYQRDHKDIEFYAREYTIRDGVFSFSAYEDQAFDTMLPDDSIKELYDEAL